MYKLNEQIDIVEIYRQMEEKTDQAVPRTGTVERKITGINTIVQICSHTVPLIYLSGNHNICILTNFGSIFRLVDKIDH
jgi:hypothetical protein